MLWGREAATSALAWPGAEVKAVDTDPRLLLGQRHAFGLPPGDFFVFMHQQRPLRTVPAATVVYDTIPLRHGGSWASRAPKRVFLTRVARGSRRVLTVSEYSRSTIVRDLGVPSERIDVLRFPFDDAFVDRVLGLRKTEPTGDVALFVGGFLPHKNIPRLLAAFDNTEFRRAGGRLVLVGGSAAQAERLRTRLDERQRAFATVRHSCPQAELDRLYATSRLLVQPSLEEGFGLPVWEAMCCGLPVCVSDGGALPEVARGFADPFPARSVPAMTQAIDACVAAGRTGDPLEAARQSEVLRRRAPSVADFGARFAEVVTRYAAAAR